MSDAALSQRLPTKDESVIAGSIAQKMGRAMTPDGSLPITISTDVGQVSIELPASIGEMMLDVLAHVAQGEMVTVVPYGSVLTTQEAADLLNVSRPFLTKLLEAGDIPFHKVGSHRRVKIEDLESYRTSRDRDRTEALRKLQRLGQEFEND
jgi:excisionase family DNA binding protein